MPQLFRLCISLVFSLGAALTQAQTTSSLERDPTLLRHLLPTWNQAEREFGFAHWELAFPMRKIARGPTVHALPAGAPLPTFAGDGEGAKQLRDYADNFKLAGIVVLADGKIRLEQYALGNSAAGRWASFSMAKSLTSTLVGAAIKDGYISSVDDPVTRYIPDLRGSAYEGVTVRQLLTMSSGVKWNEDYTDLKADVSLFYTAPIDPGVDATVSYMRKLPRDLPPGQKWVYKTGETNLIGVLVQQATKKDLASYASEKIWAPYGMEQDALWALDRTDHEHGGCCIQAATRDYARLGQFILDGARIDGKAIVADGYLEAATHKQIDIGSPGRGYGYQWWTEDDGSFDAYGIHGQMIHIDPMRHLVIAVNSAWPVATGKKESAARAALVSAVVKAIDSEAAGAPRRRAGITSTLAQYADDWRIKIERVGTLNYPPAARNSNRALKLTVEIKSDGSVYSMHVDRSSGVKLIDEAAQQIVRMAAPFPAFPPSLKGTDIIGITRTWTFEPGGSLRTE